MDNLHLQQLKSLITELTGLRILDDAASFQRVVQDRMSAFKLVSEEDYYQLLLHFSKSELANEHERLSIGLTTGETYFFRDQGQMELLSGHILPELIERNRPQRRLRIWSAGCSSGEEAYSLAMLLDGLNEDLSNWQISILGTDINPDALAKARRGQYSEWSFRQTGEQRRQRYFQFSQAKWVLRPPIRERVQFRQLNLVTEPFPDAVGDICQMDLILCRNVFIYLAPGIVSQIADKLTATLVEGGYLMTGHGELYAHHLGGLRTRIFPNSIVYQKAQLQHHQTPLAIETVQNPVQRWPDIPNKANRIVPKIAVVQAAKMPEPPLIQPATMQDAWTYANQGQPEKSRSCCEAMMEQNPLDHHPYYLSALLAQEKGEEAKALLKKVLYLAPDFIPAYLELGEVYIKENSPALAVKMWSSAYGLLQQLPLDAPIEMFGDSTVGDILKFVENRLDDQKGK